MVQQPEYIAFISYKREDKKWAKWLQRKIEGYRLPATLCKKNPHLPKKLSPTFKDTEDIRARELKEELKLHLQNSQNLIVICSPLSAQSKWVGKEIEYFISLGKGDRIILFVVDGEPYSNNPEKECVHPAIKKHLPELIAANINEQSGDWRYIRREKAFIRVISTMLNVSFDSLWQRQRRRLIRKAITWAALVILFFSSIYFVWRTNQPFEVQIALNETSILAPNLKMAEAVITIRLDNEQKIGTISNINNAAVFSNIPSRYQSKKVELLLSSFGFCDIDTMVVLSEKLSLPVRRDADYFGKIVGTVRSRSTDKFVGGAIVKVDDSAATTDSEGRFEINIPLPLQNKKYTAIVTYKGEESDIQKIFPMQNNPNNSNILFVK